MQQGQPYFIFSKYYLKSSIYFLMRTFSISHDHDSCVVILIKIGIIIIYRRLVLGHHKDIAGQQFLFI